MTPPAPSWLGWGLLETASLEPIRTLDELREPIREIVAQLVNDLCVYVDWTLEWPKFVQSVRAVSNGTLALDVR